MPRKDRPYKRGEPHRDARLFIISCEGAVREKEYFEFFNGCSSRVRINILSPPIDDPGKGSPEWVFSRAEEYGEKQGLDESDSIWLVLDIDRWPKRTLMSIQERCKIRSWGFILSNPCFELWLLLHIREITSSQNQSAKQLKKRLGDIVPEGYHLPTFIKYINSAIARARAIDPDPQYFFPRKMTTKVYVLAEKLVGFINSNALTAYADKCIADEKNRVRKRRKTIKKKQKRNK